MTISGRARNPFLVVSQVLSSGAGKVGHALVDSFSPLRTRNLRIYLGGQAVSLMGTWMQNTAQSWVVWDLSHSPFALGLVPTLATLPLLILGPWTGVWGDRLDRRRLLIATQSVAMLLAFVLSFLVYSDAIQLWHVYLLATALGVVSALDFPAQQASIGDLAGVTQIRKAVVVNAMIVQLSRMLGPALAGWVIASLGLAPAFFLNGASFLAVIATLLAVRSRQSRATRTGTKSLSDFMEGLRFIASKPRVQDLLALTTLATFFGISNMQMMPAFATDVFGGGPETLGLLMSASGAGALTSALLLVPIAQRLKRTGLILAGAVAWTGTFFVLFSMMRLLPLALAALYTASLTIPLVMTTANGLMQVLAPDHMRARLLSTWLMVSFGLQPLASLLIGFNGKLFGPPAAVRVNGLLAISLAVLLLVARPELRTWSARLVGGQPGGGRPGGSAQPQPNPGEA